MKSARAGTRERYDCDCISNTAETEQSGISSTVMDIEATVSTCDGEMRCQDWRSTLRILWYTSDDVLVKSRAEQSRAEQSRAVKLHSTGVV